MIAYRVEWCCEAEDCPAHVQHPVGHRDHRELPELIRTHFTSFFLMEGWTITRNGKHYCPEHTPEHTPDIQP